MKNTIKIMGAFVAWVMGAGFATGQEILQFFTSYGKGSYIACIVSLILFMTVGTIMVINGQKNREDDSFKPIMYYGGPLIGTFYKYFIPVSVFAATIIIVSGAGATIEEYLGIDRHIGVAVMALLAFVASAFDFKRFIDIVSMIGPVIILFTIAVGFITVGSDFDPDMEMVETESLQPASTAVMAGVLYAAYNIADAVAYYSAIGGMAATKKQAIAGALLGAVLLITAICLINTAMLSNRDACIGLAVPSYYLAEQISPILGYAFGGILLLGMFSTSAATLWTASSAVGGGNRNKTIKVTAVLALIAAGAGMFSFADLIGVIYPYMGTINIVFIICVLVKGIADMSRTHSL